MEEIVKDIYICKYFFLYVETVMFPILFIFYIIIAFMKYLKVFFSMMAHGFLIVNLLPIYVIIIHVWIFKFI